MPKQYRIGYFLEPAFPVVRQDWGCSWSESFGVTYIPNVQPWCDRFSTNIEDPDNRLDLEEVCKQVLKYLGLWKRKVANGKKSFPQPYSSADIARVVVAAVELDHKEHFQELFDICPHKIPASTYKSITAAALRYNISSILPKYASVS